MNKWLIIAAVFGFLGVALGAFAAHGLRTKLEPRAFEIWEVAVRYQMYHALALLAVALLAGRGATPCVTLAGWAFTLGIVVFSGSLYALALTDIKGLGAITPFGGVAFLVGWGALFVAGIKIRSGGPA